MLKICIYIGINAHVTPADGQTHTHGKVEQYSAEAESAIFNNFLPQYVKSPGRSGHYTTVHNFQNLKKQSPWPKKRAKWRKEESESEVLPRPEPLHY